MTTPSPATVVTAIRDWGVQFRPYGSDWAKQTTAGGWEPVGIAHHHTTGSEVLAHGPDFTLGPRQKSMLELLRVGRGGDNPLDGPLCHFAPVFVGAGRRVVYGIGARNVNHSGYMGARVARLIREGRWAGGGERGTETVDGNAIMWGLEYLHPGDATPWPDELLESGHRVAAAICEASGWDPLRWAGSNAEHREMTGRKVDRSWSGWGDGMRRRIAELAAKEMKGETPWRMSPKIEEAVRLLANARDRKLAAGRKAQAAALDEVVRDLRDTFPG